MDKKSSYVKKSFKILTRNKMKKKDDDLFSKMVEQCAEGFIHVVPLPDITPLQKLVNRLYMKLRICGMPAKEVSEKIEGLLNKHHITKEQLLKLK